MKSEKQRILTTVLFIAFLSTLFLSLFHLSSGMSMDGSMMDCPYVSHEEVICPMSLLDHITAWKAAFISIAPTLFTLAGLLISAILTVSVAPNLLRKVRLWLLKIPVHRRHSQPINYIVRPLQELFSSGILHPKVF